MDKQLAVVTGGTGGIGTAICRRLTAACHVVACYFKKGNHEQAKVWQSLQQKAGFEIDILYVDVTQYSDCEKLAQTITEKYGRLDILVNNAGVTADARLKNMTVSQWQDVINGNLTSVFNVTRNLLPLMLERNYGRIINISSINGRKGQFGQCNYAASKSALFGFTKSLAREVARQGITVNCISPGYINTPMLEGVREDVLQKIVANIPIGRLGEVTEIAEVVAFIASAQAGFMTGANLDINGGQYM